MVTSSLWTYASTAGVNVQLGIYVDPLAMFMCLVVSGVSFLIHVYSTAYLKSDPGYSASSRISTSSSSRCCCWCWRATS